MKKITLSIIILATSQFIIFSQNLDYEKARLLSCIESKDWIQALLNYYSILGKYSLEEIFPIMNKYSFVEDKYKHFSDIDNLFKKTINDDIKEIDILKIIFRGGGGCLVYKPHKVDITIGNEIKIKTNGLTRTIPKDQYIQELSTFSNIVSNCSESEYGEPFRTDDLLGTLRIQYRRNKNIQEKEYMLRFGIVKNPFIYLCLYCLLCEK